MKIFMAGTPISSIAELDDLIPQPVDIFEAKEWQGILWDEMVSGKFPFERAEYEKQILGIALELGDY